MSAIQRWLDRFCYKHPRFGIPNLMLVIVVGNVLVWLMDQFSYGVSLSALLKPLLVKSVRWSEELSIAMESRGFDGRVPRTCSQPLRLRPVDVLFPILSCALFLALFFLLGR